MRNLDAAARWLNSDPRRAIKWLDDNLTVEQQAALELVMFPVPTAEEHKVALESAKLKLIRAGITETDKVMEIMDIEIAWLDEAIEAVIVE